MLCKVLLIYELVCIAGGQDLMQESVLCVLCIVTLLWPLCYCNTNNYYYYYAPRGFSSGWFSELSQPLAWLYFEVAPLLPSSLKPFKYPSKYDHPGPLHLLSWLWITTSSPFKMQLLRSYSLPIDLTTSPSLCESSTGFSSPGCQILLVLTFKALPKSGLRASLTLVSCCMLLFPLLQWHQSYCLVCLFLAQLSLWFFPCYTYAVNALPELICKAISHSKSLFKTHFCYDTTRN